MATAVEKHREQHKDKYIWDAIPLTQKDGKPLVFQGDLDPFLPVRLRDGRPAWMVEIDPRKKAASTQIELKIPNIMSTVQGLYTTIFVSLSGSYMPSGEPHHLDAINITASNWNKKKLEPEAVDWDNFGDLEENDG